MLKYDIKCSDVVPDCSLEIKGASSEEELMSMLQAHAKICHKLEKVPPEIVQKIKKAIKKR
jgi:predicted small metal-binding protein